MFGDEHPGSAQRQLSAKLFRQTVIDLEKRRFRGWALKLFLNFALAPYGGQKHAARIAMLAGAAQHVLTDMRTLAVRY